MLFITVHGLVNPEIALTMRVDRAIRAFLPDLLRISPDHPTGRQALATAFIGFSYGAGTVPSDLAVEIRSPDTDLVSFRDGETTQRALRELAQGVRNATGITTHVSLHCDARGAATRHKYASSA